MCIHRHLPTRTTFFVGDNVWLDAAISISLFTGFLKIKGLNELNLHVKAA